VSTARHDNTIIGGRSHMPLSYDPMTYALVCGDNPVSEGIVQDSLQRAIQRRDVEASTELALL
jgi:hypothetical protein